MGASVQVCGCVCAGVWVWLCRCVGVSVQVWMSVQVCGCLCRCKGVGMSVCAGVWVCVCSRCVCVCAGVWVCLHCSVWVDLNHIIIPLYIDLTIFYFPLHSPSLPHTTSSFHVYCSSSLFIHLRLVIVHRTTQRCCDLSVSFKRWRLTALNMSVTYIPSHTHTHMHWVRYIVTCHRHVIIPVLLEGGALQ